MQHVYCYRSSKQLLMLRFMTSSWISAASERCVCVCVRVSECCACACMHTRLSKYKQERWVFACLVLTLSPEGEKQNAVCGSSSCFPPPSPALEVETSWRKDSNRSSKESQDEGSTPNLALPPLRASYQREDKAYWSGWGISCQRRGMDSCGSSQPLSFGSKFREMPPSQPLSSCYWKYPMKVSKTFWS